MNTLILKSTYKGLLDSLSWAIFWAGLAYIALSVLDFMQMQAYGAWRVKSYAEVVEKDLWGYSHDEYSYGGMIFRHWMEWAVAVVGGLISAGFLSDFFYRATCSVEIQLSPEEGNQVGWKQVFFPVTIGAKRFVFNRILSIHTTRTWLQRVTGTQTVILNLLIMEGVNAKEAEVKIQGIVKITSEQYELLTGYLDSQDVHFTTMV